MSQDFVAKVEKLKGNENYHIWQFAIKNFLAYKGLDDCIVRVESSTEGSTSTISSCKERSEEKCKQAKSIIALSVESSLFIHINKCNTALSMWECLRKLFEDRGMSRRITLLRKLLQVRLDDCESMQSYIDQVITNTEKLNGIGFEISDVWLGSILLAGLTEQYRPMIMSFEASNNLVTADEIMSKLIDQQTVQGEAFFSKKKEMKKKNKGNKKKKRKCFICQSEQHLANKCPSKKDAGEAKKAEKTENEDTDEASAFLSFGISIESKVMNDGKSDNGDSSDFLVMFSHDDDATTDINDVDISEKNVDVNSMITDYSSELISLFSSIDETNVEVSNETIEQNAMISMGLLAKSESNVWYLDSGASANMSPFEDILYGQRSANVKEIKTAGSECLKVKYEATTRFKVNENVIEVNDVLHIPDLSANLLSIYKLVCKGNMIVFSAVGCQIYNKKKVLVATIKPEHGVYKLRVTENCGDALLANTSNESIMLWHRRFAHLNHNSLLKLNDAVSGINVRANANMIRACKVCCLGKQTRLPFPKSTTRTNAKLELIHSDVAGPMRTKTIGGAKYIVTYTDDFSRKLFVYFIKEKSAVLTTFVNFKNLVENETDRKIKVLRTDNGTEYLSNEFQAIFNKCGIQHQLTCTYTPEQNGKAERANRTLFEKARCMIFDAKLDDKFWGEACQMAAYLMNRTPKMSLNNKTPEEIWSGNKPDVSMIRIFGCTVMVHVPKEKRHKLSPKSIEMIFVGVDAHAKGYRCYNPRTNKVIVSRDVKFFESSSSIVSLEMSDDLQSKSEAAKNEDVMKDDTITASPNNNVVIDDTVATLGNNTSRDDDFEDALEDDRSPILGERDETFRTRARVDELETPRKSSRVKQPFVPFQISHFALISLEPETAAEAFDCDESVHWKRAMDEEMKSHEKNGTWVLSELPIGCKAIKGKWVFKRKTNSAGQITRYKARFVAKGYAQRYGRDYYETFSPVVRHTTIRYLIALAVKNKLRIYQMDAETAFLQGDLHEDVYMEQAEKYNDGSTKVYHLKKAIYGLKQASRMWNLKLNDVLINFGFIRSKTDPCVYIMSGIIVAVYVDDFLIFYAREENLLKLKELLHRNFNMKEIGEAASCLGITIRQGENFIEIDQSHYVRQVLERFGMINCKAAVTPSDVNVKLSANMWNEEISLVGKVPYQEIIGSLLYLSGATRPDIAFATNDLSRFNDKHSEPHWKALKRVLRYLRGTIDMKLRYERQESDMIAYSDADWGSDADKRRSCTGYVIKMCNGAISWCSQRQSIVALSTTESEYIALSTTVREILWLKQLANECDNKNHSTVMVHCDNQSAIDLSGSEAYRPRTKHIDIRFHHIREQVNNKSIKIAYVSTERMIADSLTKAVPAQKTDFCRCGMGLKVEKQKN